MRGRVERLTEVVRRYDRRLYAYREKDGVIHILREGSTVDASDYFQDEPDPVLSNPQYVFSLTDDWSMNGKPVERGIDPIWFKLSLMDSHQDHRSLSERRAERQAARDRVEEEKKRARRNDFRAKALDMRSEFAKVTNDINTSGMKMSDHRRK